MHTLEKERVQTLRGLACLLLVSFHVIGHSPISGLGLPDASLYRSFVDWFVHIRMPLFTFLSGFVYAWKPIHDLPLFANKKLQRLLVPFLVVVTISFAVQQVTPGTNVKVPWQDIWTIYVLPYGRFWFLQAILVLFAVVAVLEYFKLLSRLRTFGAIFLGVLIAHFTLDLPEWFSVDKALYLAPFFLAGIGINRFREMLDQDARRAMLAGFVLLMIVHIVSVTTGYMAPKSSIFATTLGLMGVCALVSYSPRIKWLGWVGAYSFTIYLYHIFFTAGTRIALNKIGIGNTETHFVIALVLGLLGPILIEGVVRNSHIASRLLLGQSGKRKHAKARTVDASTVAISPSG